MADQNKINLSVKSLWKYYTKQTLESVDVNGD